MTWQRHHTKDGTRDGCDAPRTAVGVPVTSVQRALVGSGGNGRVFVDAVGEVVLGVNVVVGTPLGRANVVGDDLGLAANTLSFAMLVCRVKPVCEARQTQHIRYRRNTVTVGVDWDVEGSTTNQTNKHPDQHP